MNSCLTCGNETETFDRFCDNCEKQTIEKVRYSIAFNEGNSILGKDNE